MKKKTRYVFLSHGLQANHYDMLKIKHYFNNYRPDVKFICIKANEDKTTEDIRELGSNLAKEVSKFLEADFNSNLVESVSFIGHSLGNLLLIRWTYNTSCTPLIKKIQRFFQILYDIQYSSSWSFSG